jgi:hypothetical protein
LDSGGAALLSFATVLPEESASDLLSDPAAGFGFGGCEPS